jgi:hypothetical protein
MTSLATVLGTDPSATTPLFPIGLEPWDAQQEQILQTDLVALFAHMGKSAYALTTSSATGIPDPWIRPVDSRTTMNGWALFDPEDNRIIRGLQDLFGQQITALVAGVSDPPQVGRWARGEEALPAEVAARLLRASRIVALLKERQSDEDVQAWFLGRNAQLGGRAPALIVAADPDRVEDAARAFLAY